MNTHTLHLILVGIFSAFGTLQSPGDRKVGGGCEACELMYEGMPENLSARTRLALPNEPGEPMMISGTIYKKDGRTPAPNVILYVYHTDNTGEYTPSPNQKIAQRHGHLRGWMKTDSKGYYEFTSIRPAAYPGRKNPAHIHPLIKEEGLSLYWIDEYLFDDDPILTKEERANQQKRGGNGIIKLARNANGVWIGHRDIILGLNVPGY
jgi:protocatechuate 3,4-dioxygenase, beta subunit